MKDIYQIDENGYPYGYMEFYHGNKIACRGFRKKPNLDIGYSEVHFQSPIGNLCGIAYYYIK